MVAVGSENGRRKYLHLDIIKVIALCMMPICHVYEEAYRFELLSSSFPNDLTQSVMGFFYNMVPTLFMISMGATIVLSRHNSPKDLIRRGSILIGIFFVLNVFRFLIPSLISIPITGNTEIFTDNISEFFVSDILMFAGLALIVIGIAKRYDIPTGALVIVSLLMLTIQTFLPTINFGTSMGEKILNDIIGWFVYTSPGYSYFPLTSWFIFPTIGMLYSEILIKKDSGTVYHRNIILISAVIMAAIVLSSILGITGYEYTRWSYDGFFLSLLSGVFALSFCGIIIGVTYLLFNEMPSCRFSHIMTAIAKEVNGIYCIHWVLVMWAVIIPLYLLEIYIDNPFYIVMLGLILFVVSYALSMLFKNRFRHPNDTCCTMGN